MPATKVRLCKCGCGNHTELAKWNDKRRGHIKGESLPFLPFHNSRKNSNLAMNRLRFNSKIVGDCWEWQGGGINSGYGKTTYQKRQVTTHRLSWILNYGDVPEDLKVLHRCDNRKCINPKHLFLGTSKENTQDMMQKGRHNNGRGKCASDEG